MPTKLYIKDELSLEQLIEDLEGRWEVVNDDEGECPVLEDLEGACDALYDLRDKPLGEVEVLLSGSELEEVETSIENCADNYDSFEARIINA